MHKRTHSVKRPYACGEPDCEYSATQAGNLARHKRTHSGERSTGSSPPCATPFLSTIWTFTPIWRCSPSWGTAGSSRRTRFTSSVPTRCRSTRRPGRSIARCGQSAPASSGRVGRDESLRMPH
ncbi:hypothetical protein T492DRAFT_1051294 [Pavlovales sp. CCMP2436]|nr:hypothetical protein T492DRAFT_1051294 [Pavlovales sp. CCMP2436]